MIYIIYLYNICIIYINRHGYSLQKMYFTSRKKVFEKQYFNPNDISIVSQLSSVKIRDVPVPFAPIFCQDILPSSKT